MRSTKTLVTSIRINKDNVRNFLLIQRWCDRNGYNISKLINDFINKFAERNDVTEYHNN